MPFGTLGVDTVKHKHLFDVVFLGRVKHDAGAEQVFEKKKQTPNNNKQSDAASGNCVISTHFCRLDNYEKTKTGPKQ